MNNAHILGTERIGKLLVQYSIPAIIGMTITSLYNIIDSIFIGHGVGPMGIAGLAITFPLMNLVVAFCTMVSAGGSTISSIRLGQKDLDGATEVLGNTLMFCLVNAFIFGSVSFIFLDDILRFFGASNDTLPYARDFMQVILLGTPVTYTMIGLNNIMRATGYPKKAMLTSMVTVVCNIILAPIFIFQFDWGIRGAATATVISQFIGMVWVVSHFLQKTSVVRLQRGFWKMKKRIISSILSIGMSPFLMNVTACVIVIIVNNSLQQYGGDMAIGAYGIINRLLVLYVMIVLGLTMGMQPIVGYNFGAQKHGIRIGGWFAGHYACDYETTFCHIPYFLIDSVRPQPIKSLFPNVRKCTERGLGAETEDLWDVLLLKPNQRRIYLLRFGAGEDRVFDY